LVHSGVILSHDNGDGDWNGARGHFLREYKLLRILEKTTLLLLNEALLHVPWLIVLNGEKVFREVAAHHYLGKVLSHILNHHTKNSIVLIPRVLISLASFR
jgi:hypothetical protein